MIPNAPLCRFNPKDFQDNAMHEFLKRREFVKLTSAGMAAASVLDASQVQAGRGANDKLVVALIGCGGRGMSDAGQFKKLLNVEIAIEMRQSISTWSLNRRTTLHTSATSATAYAVAQSRTQTH